MLARTLHDESVALFDTAAAQLLAMTAPDGLADPFGAAAGGWTSGPPSVDPYTTTGGDNTVNSFVGQNVNPYTGTRDGGDNPNAYRGGGGVDPFAGAAPSSLLSSPDLLAFNDTGVAVRSDTVADVGGPSYIGVSNSGEAVSDAAGFAPQVSDTASDTGGSFYTGSFTENGVTYMRFADVDGFVYEFPVEPSGIASTGSTGSPSPSGAVAPATPYQSAPPATAAQAPPAPVQSAPATAAQASPAAPSQLAPASSPAPPTSPPAGSPAAADIPRAQPPTSPSATPRSEAPSVSYDPMADSPIARWLLYSSGTPARDFLTSDANLSTAQTAALGVSAVAATLATGGLLLEAAPAALGASGAGVQSSAIASAVAPLATAGAGIAASGPNLAGEIEETVAGAGPALGSELGTLAAEIEGSLPTAPTSTVTSVLFQARDAAAQTARSMVQQELAAGQISTRWAQARFGALLDAIAKSAIRQAVSDGRLPNTFVTSPTVSISRGYLRAWISAPDTWDTATGHAWDFMSSTERAFYTHENAYLGTRALGGLDPAGTIITEIFPLFHQGL